MAVTKLAQSMIASATAFGLSLLSAADAAAAKTLLTPDAPVGQCYLLKSGANLLLLPEKGNKLWINGALQTVPDAGVTLAPSGLSSGTAYFIYAYMSGATMTLESSATAPEVNSTTGVRQKTGDATRTLVGLWLATGTTTWSSVACQGASWFNPRLKMGTIGPVTQTTTSTATSPPAELSASLRLDFVNFSARTPRVEVAGRAGVSVASSDATVDIGLDGTTVQLTSPITMRNGDTNGNDQTPFFGTKLIAASEGKHYATALAAISTGTGTFTAVTVQVTIEG